MICPFARPKMPSSGWAGSPAASSPTAPKPNAPSSSPNSSAASTPPPNSWTPPGHRYAKPSPATASACRPAIQRRLASGPLPQPASGVGGRPPRPWIRCSWRSTLVCCRLESGQRPSCMSGSAARSSTPPWAPTWWSSCTAKATRVSPPPAPWAIIRRADRSHRLDGQRASRPDRRHADRADRASRSQQSQEREMAADVR